jgi:O-acetyl-ADP-ribose deacetylase (regulator of RNase III)
MADIQRSHTLPGGQVLRVVQGDLTKETSDAIVNAANEWLAHGGGVAGAIVRRGGLEVQWESDAWVEKHGKLPVGGVAVTGAGMLPCKKVIHAVGPVWEGGDDDEEDNLRAAAANSLTAAHDLGLRSLSMPAISSGIFGFPKSLCAEILVDAAVDWFAQNPGASVRELRFTNIDRPTVEVFLEVFEARFGMKR